MTYWWLLFVALTALCWGAYGPSIHEGTVLLKSPWKAFLFVGVAYFVIAVVGPLIILKAQGDSFQFTGGGILAASIAGALGAIGALGVIAALKAGGKPVYVMPLVFGVAPVINVAVSWGLHPPKASPHPLFFVGIAVLAAGAGMVLYFKPQ